MIGFIYTSLKCCEILSLWLVVEFEQRESVGGEDVPLNQFWNTKTPHKKVHECGVHQP